VERTEQHMEDRAVLVLGALSRLASRATAALCGEVSWSPLEASQDYCPYLLGEEIEVPGWRQNPVGSAAGPDGSCRPRGRPCHGSTLWQGMNRIGVCTATVPAATSR